jgi:MFS family permease
MGTARDWIEVAFMTVFWGAVMFWISLATHSEHRTKLRALSMLSFTAGGFLVGLLTTFGLTAFRWSLVALVVVVFAVLLVVKKTYSKKLLEPKAISALHD